jgi:cytochrome c-type biogenesis protein
MGELVAGAGLALWLGILTSIMPCPLATNIAAISYIGRRVDSSRQVFLAGIFYAVGRTVTYLVLAVVLVTALRTTREQLAVGDWLQKYMVMLLGPVLIVVAMLLLDLLPLGGGGSGVSENMQKRVNAWGIWGGLLLGVLFALSFCPLSAGLFFVSLIPMVKLNSSILLPSLYGIGTALPVLVFALLIAFSVHSVGKAFHRLSQFEWWARRITAVIFLAVGVHFALKYSFGIVPFWDPWVQAAIRAVPFWRGPVKIP